MDFDLPVEPLPANIRKPEWLRVHMPSGDNATVVGHIIQTHHLFTVCEEAQCPNRSECWSSGTATFMLMGGVCTRGCRFCAVTSGHPEPLDDNEPMNVANAIYLMKLNYVVLTSVDRDDLPDGGSKHFAQCIQSIKSLNPEILIEVLIPDFLENNLKNVITANPDVIAHNIETVERLSPHVRDPRATYTKSLRVLREIKEYDPSRYTKSSIMVGLGETWEDLEKTFLDLRKQEVDFLTIGQYLRPSSWHLPVVKYIHPDLFIEMKERALVHGFKYVAAGPLVRSSYRAGEFFIESLLKHKKK